MKTIDMRSDTVTMPGAAMKEAMFSAELGDDVFGEDPTVNALESKMADLLGKEAALFCPTGTMTNQISINVHCRPLDELICDQTAHITQYEGGGPAFHSGVSVKALSGDRGRISAEQVAAAINPDDVHKSPTRLVCIENSCNKGGGTTYKLDQIREIAGICRKNALKMHLDGARLFNALTATRESPRAHADLFDSVSICLSKGLGCPSGSVLIGDGPFIQRARRVRKVLGGGMRQAGILAAAGIYALDHNIARLSDDHRRAKRLAEVLESLPYVSRVIPVETNLVLFELDSSVNPTLYLRSLAERGLKGVSMGGQLLRLVTHLDISEEDTERACEILKQKP